jgi:hypothetical protein
MDLEALELAVRGIVDDLVEPYQFPSTTVARLFNDAIAEACIRTRVLQDATSRVARLTLSAGVSRYTLHPSIFAVRRARIDGEMRPLEMRDTSELDAMYPGWDEPTYWTPGTPTVAVFDHGTRSLVLHRTPDVAGALLLLVWRAPTEAEELDANDPSGVPAVPVHMHRELCHWVAAHLFLNADDETRSPKLAAKQFALFEAAYGRKPDLHEIRAWSTNRRRRVPASFD